MGTEWIAHEAEGRMGERNNCFSKIQLVGQNYRDKTTLVLAKRDSASIALVFNAGAFRYKWAITSREYQVFTSTWYSLQAYFSFLYCLL